jgi:hypothetical protein
MKINKLLNLVCTGHLLSDEPFGTKETVFESARPRQPPPIGCASLSVENKPIYLYARFGRPHLESPLSHDLKLVTLSPTATSSTFMSGPAATAI